VWPGALRQDCGIFGGFVISPGGAANGRAAAAGRIQARRQDD